MPVPIRRPIRRYARHPNRGILRILDPVALIIQIGVARDVARYIARRRSHIFATIALLAPVVKRIGDCSCAPIEQRTANFFHHTNLFARPDRIDLIAG